MNWKSLATVIRVTATAHISRKLKARLLGYIAQDILCIPFRFVFEGLDDWLFDYQKTSIEKPLFIIGQPRCGTTLLHRTLADDKENFFAVTYLEWRYPYITVWWLLDKLNLRRWVNGWCYWPNTRLGKLANKMHPHYFGDYEEHGVFLEEKFYNHYFVYRRFPFPEVLQAIDYSKPDKMIEAMLKVVRKVKFYHGYKGSWITKENESIEVYSHLIRRLPDARMIFVERDAEASLYSFKRLSAMSTMAKTGVDPRRMPDWEEANMGFRMKEILGYYCLKNSLPERKSHTTVRYEEFISDIAGEVYEIYHHLGLSVPQAYQVKLARRTVCQQTRERGY